MADSLPPLGDARRLVDYGLADKAVIVTGAAGGIGRAVATLFAQAGARVLAVDRSSDLLDELRRTIGDGHAFLGTDLTESGAADEIIERAVSELGSVEVLAHVAGSIRRRDKLSDVTEADWDNQLDVNLKASFFVCRAAAEQMVRQGTGGRVIAFSSQAWWTGGFGGSVVYAASKGGLVSMARGFARTYGPHGITVNTVAPGLVRTPMVLDGSLSEETIERLVEATPLGRLADPEEIASVVLFLASKQASFVSGATINVSGGLLMY